MHIKLLHCASVLLLTLCANQAVSAEENVPPAPDADTAADADDFQPAIVPMIRDESAGRQALLRRYLEPDPEQPHRLRARSDANLEEAEDLLAHPRQLEDEGLNLAKRGVVTDYDDSGVTGDTGAGAGASFDPYYIGPDDDDRTGFDFEKRSEKESSKPSLKDLLKRSFAGGKRKRTITAPYGTGAGKQPVYPTVTNYYDSVYYTNVQLGTPGVWYSVVIDTGSADLWVPSPKCGTACAQRKTYNPANSRTALSLGVRTTVWYGLGSATGPVYQDVMRIGGLQSNANVFIQAETMNNNQPANVDGLLGLSFSALSWANYAVPRAYKGQSAIVENLWNAGQIPAAAFGIWLSMYDPLNPTKQGGELTIGSTTGNYKRYTGAITWLSVPNTANWWHVAVDYLTVGNSGNLITPTDAIRGVVDTGTALLLVDYDTAAAGNAKLGGYPTGIYGLWGINCGTLKKNPTVVTFTMGGRKFTFTGADLAVQVYPNDRNLCYAPFQASKANTVGTKWILGEIFLRKYYSIYDYNVQRDGSLRPRVGLATSIP